MPPPRHWHWPSAGSSAPSTPLPRVGCCCASAFMSRHFQNQLTFLLVPASFAFVREPETNGVAERFIRTLKRHIVFGRIHQNIEDIRATRCRSNVDFGRE